MARLDWADPAFPRVCPRAVWKGHGPLSQLGGPRVGVTGALDRLAMTERVITGPAAGRGQWVWVAARKEHCVTHGDVVCTMTASVTVKGCSAPGEDAGPGSTDTASLRLGARLPRVPGVVQGVMGSEH